MEEKSGSEETALPGRREQLDRELRTSEELNRRIIEAVPCGLVVVSLEGAVLKANAEARRTLGLSFDELTKRFVSDFRPETFWEDGTLCPVEDYPVSKCLATGQPQPAATIGMRRPDGQISWAIFTAIPFFDPGTDRMIGAVVTFVDITERKQAEQKLRESEERFRTLFENLPIGAYRTSAAGEILNANPALVRMLGYDSFASLASRNLEKEGFAPGYSRQEFHRQMQQQGSIKGSEAVWTKRDGSLMVVRENARVIRDSEGALFYEGTVEDITEQKLAEEAFKASEQRYRELVENASEIIYTHDLEGSFTSINRAGELITGYSRDEILRMNIVQLVAPASRELVARLIERQASTNAAADELTFLTKEGRELTMEVSIRFLYQEWRVSAVLGIARDVTQRRQFEEQLRHSQKMEAMGKLAGGVAHDFNNFLTAILGYSQLALAQLDPAHPIRKDLEEISRTTEYAAALARQLLAIGRRQIMSPRILKLNEFVGDMNALLRRLIGEDVELRFVADPNLAPVSADPGMIEQVILNLVLNARDAMPKGGKLTLETANVELDPSYTQGGRLPVKPGSYVMLAVTDTGVGMDAQTQSRVFEPFFTTKAPGKGTGLGLSMAYGIVKQNAGYIWVYSQVGVGTTFKIYLPQAKDEPPVSLPLEARSVQLQGSETILLVEDDTRVRALARGILETNGYRVVEASSGEEALTILGQWQDPIHLLVTDVVMPKMSGRALAQRTTLSRPDMKVLYISGYAHNSIIHHDILERGEAFLQKPFTPSGLVSKVREVLDAGVEANRSG